MQAILQYLPFAENI